MGTILYKKGIIPKPSVYSASTIGNAVTLLAVDADTWVATNVMGTWTVSGA